MARGRRPTQPPPPPSGLPPNFVQQRDREVTRLCHALTYFVERAAEALDILIEQLEEEREGS